MSALPSRVEAEQEGVMPKRNLVPTQTMDKRGFLTTRHKADPRATAPPAARERSLQRIQNVVKPVNSNAATVDQYPLTQEDIDRVFASPLDEHDLGRLKSYANELTVMLHKHSMQLMAEAIERTFRADCSAVYVEFEEGDEGRSLPNINAIELDGEKVSVGSNVFDDALRLDLQDLGDASFKYASSSERDFTPYTSANGELKFDLSAHTRENDVLDNTEFYSARAALDYCRQKYATETA